MARAWLREDEPDLAVDKILDAAEKTFIECGVSAASMARVAESAGCSRGTLYRYFKTRHDLHLGYVNRAALRISARLEQRLRDIEDPRERAVEAILFAVQEVRRDPATAAWFEPGVSGMAARMSRSSEVIQAITGAFVRQVADDERRLQSRWVVRIILSLLSMPGQSDEEERELLERFVRPTLG